MSDVPMSPSSGHDTPAPLDNDEPPPRKRGLGRGLADLTRAGSSIGTDGQPYYGLDALLWAADRAHSRRAAERTPQPKVLGRLPEPLTTGPIAVADILAAQHATVPKPRSLAESVAILNRALEHPSEAIRVRDDEQGAPAIDVAGEVMAPALEAVSQPVAQAAPEPAAQPAGRVNKFAWMLDDD